MVKLFHRKIINSMILTYTRIFAIIFGKICEITGFVHSSTVNGVNLKLSFKQETLGFNILSIFFVIHQLDSGFVLKNASTFLLTSFRI